MADHRHEFSTVSRQRGGSASLMLAMISGAVLGAAGLGWWLLGEADRRRRHRALESPLGSRTVREPEAASASSPLPLRLPRSSTAEPALQERVQQLNQAIDEVRRQLEALQPQP